MTESEAWQLAASGKYYLTRNDSSIIAFTLNKEALTTQGWRLFGAHTDSPCLKVKPRPELHRQQIFQLGVEVYGGALLNPWFDRDLSLAGRVHYSSQTGELCSTLINFERPIAVIPSLAIHLDREANNERKVNPQTDIPPALLISQNKPEFKTLLSDQLVAEGADNLDRVLDYELCFYDTQPAAQIGLKHDFITSARLDNLLSCYVGLQALIQASDADTPANAVLVCNDHEEVGSQSAIGAQGPMLSSTLQRIAADHETLNRALANSWMISADNAHGIHPNYADRHDGNHGPLLNAGPVIKLNANQRYASNSETAALFRQLCDAVSVPVQNFVVRSDMGCGSTIGPITASRLGIRTVDIGVPTFAMHSVRETAGSEDAESLFKVSRRFFQ